MTNKKLSLLATFLLGASWLTAQEAAQPATPPSESDEDVVRLTPFTVSATDDHGYVATSTLAGTRLRTDLRDVGAAVSVVTKDFLQDTGATNAGTLLTYLPNTEVAGVHGNYSGFGNSGTISENYLNPQSTTRVRGLDNADTTRDYFVSSIPWDSFNVDRVDTIRGPNSILYGLGSPAGIINTSLNAAMFRNATNVEARYGRFGTVRGSLDTNVVLIPKQLALRFDAEATKTKYQQQEAFNHDNRVFGTLKFQPSALNTENMTTIINANVETGKIVSNNPEMSPPDDQITPWFDASKANKFVSDPMADWSVNQTTPNGPVYTMHGMVSGSTGKGQSADAKGNPNPSYQPWMSTMGFQGGTTLLTGVNPHTPYGLTFWQPQLGIGSYASVNGHAINGIPYNQVNGIAGYRIYAQQAALPQWQTGLYKDHYLTDTSIFDFRHHMLEGDNARQYQNWTAYSASLAQTFLHDRIGYELVARQEQYSSSQWRLFDGPGSINIVTDKYYVEPVGGTGLNPDFGKPFLVGSGQYSNSSVDETRKNARLTVFGEVRGEDLFGVNSTGAYIFGRQRFTGLESYDRDDRDNRSWMLYATDPAYNALYNQGTTQAQSLSVPHIVSFLGNSLYSASTASGANLSPASRITVPTDGATRQWIAKWTAPSTLDPAGAWTPPAGGDPLTNADNPANYQGWTTVPVHVMSAFNPAEKDQLYTYGQKQETKVTSQAAIWQGFFLDGTIVPLFGIRRDTVQTGYAQPKQRANNTMNINDPSYRVTTLSEEKGTTRTYSLVVHLPRQVRDKLPAGLDVSAFYNRSENFQPGAGRVDVFGDPIANPSGKTKDYGVLISLWDQKVTLKVNRFQTDLENSSLNGLSTWALGASVTWNYEFDQFYKNTYGQDWQNHFNPWSSQTPEQAAAQQAAAVAAVDKIASDPMYQRFTKAWQINQTGTGWQTLSTSYTAPAGFAQTQDTHSKGWEYELTTQLTKNWTLTANASKTDAVVSNVGGTGLNQWVNYWTNVINGPAGDIRLWWGGSTATTRTQFQGDFLSGWQLAQLGAGSDVSELRPWHFNLITNYRFDRSVLKGFSVGGGYRWASHNILGYPATLDSNNVWHFSLNKPYYGKQESAVDLWAGYDFKPGRKTNWHIQFNVRNAFGSQDLIPVTVEPDGSPAAYRMPEPVTWELTTRVSF